MGRRTRLLLALAGIALLAALLTRGVAPALSPAAGQAGPAPTPLPGAHVPPEAHVPPGGSPPSLPSRNPFRYAEEAKSGVRLAPRPVAAPTAAPPAPPPIRFVGLVTREGNVRAALALLGDVLVAGPGEEVAGYRVLAIDEETGVRVRTPDGREILLRLEQ